MSTSTSTSTSTYLLLFFWKTLQAELINYSQYNRVFIISQARANIYIVAKRHRISIKMYNYIPPKAPPLALGW